MADNSEQTCARVTGAASGLGRATTALLRQRGVRVAGLDLEPKGVEADLALGCDIADAAAVQAAVRQAVERLGRLDLVAHCAATFPSSAVPLHALDPAIWRRTVDVNLNGAFAVARSTLPELVGSRGAMVLVASVAGDHPQPGAAVYTATKAAVAALARAIAIEYAHLGVRANSVSPGWMDTAMAAPVLSREHLRRRVEERVPLGRVAAPEEVAEAIVWLLSEAAGYVTGQDLVIDAGMSLAAFVDDGEVAATWRRGEG